MRRLLIGLALTCLPVAVPAGPASGAPLPARATADFDGDGYGDLAIGAPYETIGSAAWAGAVTVLYGSAGGLRTARSQQWHQNAPGIAGGAETRDRFGAELAAGDFDGDGHSDLAVGAPGEALGQKERAGVVHVIYGSPTGLSASGSELWRKGADGVPGVANAIQDFGGGLAAGNFDGDSRVDLAIAGFEGPKGQGRGAVWVLYGVAGGLEPAATIVEPDHIYATEAAAGDFDGDGADDLAVGGGDYERVVVLHGSKTTGLSVDGAQYYDVDTPGVEGEPQQPWEEPMGDYYAAYFGTALAAADFDRDGYADLVIGAPGENVPGRNIAGAVHVLPGSPSGPTGTGSRRWHEGVAGVPGDPGFDDQFGAALGIGDFDGDSRPDLAIGIPGEGGGRVVALYAGTSGLTTTGVQRWHQNVNGVPGVAERDDAFGAALTAGDVDGDRRDDLGVGVPRENVGGLRFAGAVNVVHGATIGLVATGSQLWHQDVAGVPGAGEAGDSFGRALSGAGR